MRSSDHQPQDRTLSYGGVDYVQGDLLTAALIAKQRVGAWLVERQDPSGFWCAELEGDSILQSEYILLLAFLGLEQSPLAKQCARQLLKQQQPGGGWAMYPGGRVEISGSVKAYLALKLTGEDPASEPMRRACETIRQHGGADAVNSFTRFYLALLGQISYELCPAVPPEMMLLPDWAPVNIYRMSAWSRTIFVPLSIVWAQRPVRTLPVELGISELFIRAPECWPPLRSPGAGPPERGWNWERFFRRVDELLKFAERREWHPLRRRALRAAESWMLERFADSDGLGAIFPPIIWSIIALQSLGHAPDSPAVRECHDQLARLMITENDTTRLQPCLSPVWDTALSARALGAAGVDVNHPSLCRVINWLLTKEVRQPGDWSKRVPAEPGGWFFEHRNAFYPDVDDTIMVLMALRYQFATAQGNLPQNSGGNLWRMLPRRHDSVSATAHSESPTLVIEGRIRAGEQKQFLARTEQISAACQRALKWVLAMQNRDGGWGAFDKDNDWQLLCEVPFADHNAMIDPSTPDITGRVLEMLGQYGFTRRDACVQRAIEYLRATQEADGSWYGRWGVNYIYGTWQALAGLAAVDFPRQDPLMTSGVRWLLDHQQPHGGWGESADSYEDHLVRGQGPATASQTAWAILGLLAAGLHDHAAVRRGISYLVNQQQNDGSWQESEFTGTGFPRVFYLRYHYYPIYFPLLALAEWTKLGN
ncbi:MAG: prenyltransferase/squalene oxidase repeat-containing protein [Planctomycetota bacterium]